MGELWSPHAVAEGPANADLGEGPEEVVYAGFVTRMIAIALDALLIDVAALAVAGAVLLVFSVFAVATSGAYRAVVGVIGAVAFVVWVVAYFGVCWTTTGQTPGGRVMHIRLTRVDGSRLRPRHVVIRLVWMVLSLPLFWGYLPVLINLRRRGAFDLFAGTIVTHTPSEAEPPSPHGQPHLSGIDPPTTVPSPGTE
jgi:uncharacterized RDD family membrane protein YckC